MKLKNNHVWFRSISSTEEDLWRERLVEWSQDRLVFLQSNRSFFVHVYAISPAKALALKKKWGGTCREIKPYETSPEIELNLFGKFKVQSREISKPDPKILWVPAEMAFGTGDHPTTAMILRQMIREKNWEKSEVLDVGCGSGILALMARKLGSKKILGFDNDPACVRISKVNEARNFEGNQITWKEGALGKLKSKGVSDYLLANLYSGLFQMFAGEFKGWLKPSGKMICSGILKIDLLATCRALEKAGLKVLQTQTKGKWAMMVLKKK
ncbi:MAG: 50S ribosomal protein L11 methyltransferase [Verrucomicrobiota bacterium]